jgi:hypothetical protein
VRRRSQLKAMREAGAALKAFAESATGVELRETVRRLSESDIVKKMREAAKGFPVVDRSTATIASAAEVKEALAGLQDTEDDESDAPAPRSRRKGGRPPDHNWSGAEKYLDDWLKVNVLPEVKQRLIEVMQDWFKKVDGGVPNDRQISRKLIDRLYPAKLPRKAAKLPR